MDNYKYPLSKLNNLKGRIKDLSTIDNIQQFSQLEDQDQIICSILNDLFQHHSDRNALLALINLASECYFFVPPLFFNEIILLLQNKINVDLCLCLMKLIIHFPIECFINAFPFKEIIQEILKFVHVFPDAISILSFFLQNINFFPGIDKFYIDIDVIQTIEVQLSNANTLISTESLNFFRYLLKTNIPFLPNIKKIYDRISEMTLISNSSNNLFAIHTIYHFTKKYIQFCKDEEKEIYYENNKEIYFKSVFKNLLFPKIFDNANQLQIDNQTFLYYLMKFIASISRIVDIFKNNPNKLINLNPIIQFSLNTTDQSIIKCALASIYNFLRDGKEKAFKKFYDVNLEKLLFQDYYNFGFDVQKEVVFVLIEFTYYMKYSRLIKIFKRYNLLQIFIDMLLSDDEELIEDLFLCFINIYDTLESHQKLSYIDLYFKNNDFVSCVLAIEPTSSTYFDEFIQKMQYLTP